MGERLRGGHVALVTGLKHYLGPFDAYGKSAVPGRLFGKNRAANRSTISTTPRKMPFFAGSKQFGFTWSVHRPHTIIGFAVGNAMNMGQTLAVYATLCI